MEWVIPIVILFGLLFFLLFMGVPVAFSFLCSLFVGSFVYLGGAKGVTQMSLHIFDALTRFSLSPVPMFIILGTTLWHSGLGSQVITAIDKWVGRVPGRLALVVVVAGSILGAVSGSTLACTAMLTALMVPVMKQRGYKTPMIAGPIIAVGGLDMLIPPSTLTVIYATLADISIGAALVSTIVPAVIIILGYSAYILITCKLHPDIAPAYQVSPIPFTKKVGLTLRDIAPMFVIIYIVIGSIFFGIATPEESAAAGALATILLTIPYKRFNWQMLKDTFIDTGKIFAMLFFILAGSTTFSQLVSITGIANAFCDIVTGLHVSKLLTVCGLQGLIFVLGGPMDEISNMMIHIPTFRPVWNQLGIDKLWFGCLALINLKIALESPPLGLVVFITKAAFPELTMLDITKSYMPYFLIDIAVFILVLFFPLLATWLPSLMQ